jgi:pilus assembly protein FimV
MAVDKNKIVAEATRFAQKGQYDKAIKAYERILAEDKKEVRTLLKIGEIQQKKGDTPSAAETFNQVAEIYGEQGFFLKAVAVYKQIAKLTPDDVRVNEKLAGLYQQLGLLNDATNQLQAVATAFEKAGDHGRHLDVLRRLLDLDPENVVTCQRLGDLYAKANRGAEALELYHRAAAHLKENKRGDEYVKLAERIFQLTPDDLKLAKELAQEYLARGETKKALGKLQICHGTDKQDVDTLRLMAQAFRDLGQVSKTIAVYRALARVYAERGRREESAVTWRMVLELLPDDPEAREELAASGTAKRSPGIPVEPLAPRPAVVAPPPPDAAPGRTVAPRPAEVRGVPPQVMRPAVAAQGAPQSPVERILTETDVYLKYGLHQKALDHVEKLLETDPENPDALERIRDIRETMGDLQGAAVAAGRAVKALAERGEEGRLTHATERLRQLDPSQAPAGEPRAPGEELPLPDGEPPAAVLAAVPEEAPEEGRPEPAPVADEAAPDAATPEEPVLAIPPDDDALKSVTGPEGPAPVQDDEAPIAVDADRGMPAVLGDDSPFPVDDMGMEVDVAAPERETTPEQVDVPQLDGPPLEVEIDEVEPEDVEEVAPRTPPPLVLVPPPIPERSWEPLDAEMEEVGFYERQGLLDEALLAIREIAAAHPGHPDVEPALARIERLAALEAGGAETPAGEEPATAEEALAQAPTSHGLGQDRYGSTGTTGIFDLGAELSAELGPELTPTPTGEFQYSVADVFDQFKRGLEKTVRPDDSATKYDLGIAFQEMGMLDEALEQFRSALAGGDRRREVEILNMIGICLGLKARHEEAIEAYQQALGSEFLTDEASKALHFELGAAHEALGQPEAALGYFQKVAQVDPGYRSVAERVSRLAGGPGGGQGFEARLAPGAKKGRKR